MSRTLNIFRRACCAFSVRTTLAAALVALACSGCAEMQQFAHDWDTFAEGMNQKIREFNEAKNRTIFRDPMVTAQNRARTGVAVVDAGGARQPITGAINSTKALAFLYGEVRNAKPGEKKTWNGEDGNMVDCTEWVMRTLPEKTFEYYPEYRGKKVEACKIFDEKYGNHEGKYMLVTQIADGNIAIISVSIFAENGDQWVLEVHRDIDITDVADGAASYPGFHFQHASLGTPGMLLSYNDHGNKCASHGVAAIIPYGSGVEIFPLGDDGFFASTCDNGWNAVEGLKAVFDEASSGDYYDIITSYRDIKERLHKQRWHFQNGKYIKVKTSSGKKKTGVKKRK